MPAKRASSALAGSGATKRRVKSTARRPYPPPKNMMIRAPSGAPVDATVEDTDSDADSDDSDDSDADSDSGSESESMEVDEDTGEEVTTARPLGRATERRLLMTTRYEYDAASLTFVDGEKHRVVPGTCVVVNFFDETANDTVVSCPAIVRTIFSVEKNNPRDCKLNGEATAEEVNRDGVLFGVSWLLDVTHTKKQTGGKNYKPPYDIPANERFYDPRTTDSIIPPNIDRVVPEIAFLARRRNMSNRPAYPDPETGVLFVNKIVGLVNGNIVTHPISDNDYDDATTAHLEFLLEMHAPKDEDEPRANTRLPPVRTGTPGPGPAAVKNAAAKKKEAPKEKRKRDAEPDPARAPARSRVFAEIPAANTLVSITREEKLERRAERAERRVAELEAKLQMAEKKIQQAKAEAEARLAAAAEASTPKKHSGGAFSSSVTLARLGALARQCKIVGLEDEVNAAAGEFGSLLVADAEKLMTIATSLERRILGAFPRDGKIGRSQSVRELVEYVRGPDSFASRVLLGELDASSLEILRVEAERAAAKENDDDDDDDDDDDVARAPAIPRGVSATDAFGLTETQKRNLSMSPTAFWRANPAQLEYLEARFAEAAAGGAEPFISREERVRQTLELAKLGPILEQKVQSWWSNRRMKQRKLDAESARPSGASASSPRSQAVAKQKTKKKKPLTPYLRFVQEQIALGRQLGKVLGAEWRAMSEEEKAAYKVDEVADQDTDEDGQDDGQDAEEEEEEEEDEP